MESIMLTYKFLIEDKIVDIDIELIDNELVKKWKKIIRNTCKNLEINWFISKILNKTMIYSEIEGKQSINNLINSYTYLTDNKYGDFSQDIILLKKLLNNITDIDQTMLNKMHRDFTHFETTFIIDYNIADEEEKKFYRVFHNINENVHKLENFTYYKSALKTKFINNDEAIIGIQFTNANNNVLLLKNDNYNYWSHTEVISSNFFDIFRDNYDYSVWINEDIVGKDQIKAWLDEDDLTKFDVTGNEFITPSIMLDPFKIFKRIFDDENFRNDSKKSCKAVDRLPLGNIITTNIDYHKLLAGELIGIYLDNEKIWEAK